MIRVRVRENEIELSVGEANELRTELTKQLAVHQIFPNLSKVRDPKQDSERFERIMKAIRVL